VSTKQIQKRSTVKAKPAKGLENESEEESDLEGLENEIEEENALAELELQQSHIQGTNEEEDQVFPLSPSLPFPLYRAAYILDTFDCMRC
jgi:hypothetical protein